MKRMILWAVGLAVLVIGAYVALCDYSLRLPVKGSLVIFQLDFDNVDVHCGPSMPDDDDVVFVCTAGFTRCKSPIYWHGNICDSHTSYGEFHKAASPGNKGTFTFYDGKWHFSKRREKNADLCKAARRGGCGFMQYRIISDGCQLTPCYKLPKVKYYRALCELDGRLCVIEAKNPMKYADFVSELMALHVTHAMYLDTGFGWDYYKYRDSDGRMHSRHFAFSPFRTNYLVFRKSAK